MRAILATLALAGGAVFAAEPQLQVHVEYVAAEFDGGVVKGAPYSAEAVTETTQVLPDGNRIVNKNTAFVYRDSQGRTRREQTVGSIGALAVNDGEPLRIIAISDPVAGVTYTMDSSSKSVKRMTAAKKVVLKELPPGSQGTHETSTETIVSHGGIPSGALWVEKDTQDTFEIALPPPAGSGMQHVVETRVIRHSGDEQAARVEPLGRQVIEGVEVQGTRQTTVIPAGQIGNERPIEITSERWYSPRLQTVVLSRRNDPRMGETVYRLTNINLSEPPASLFEPPAGFEVKDTPSGDKKVIHIEKKVEKK
jgi:hypothetical protein